MTNKVQYTQEDITSRARRERVLFQVKMKQFKDTHGKDPEKETVAFTNPEKHYHIAASTKGRCDVNAFVSDYADNLSIHASPWLALTCLIADLFAGFYS
jgi:hypothetical protein